METLAFFLILIIILIAFFILLMFFIKIQIKQLSKNNENETLIRWLESMQDTMDVRLKNVQNELGKTTQTLSQNSLETSKLMTDRLDKASEIIGKVQKELGTMSEIGHSMKDLQDFLKTPKLRGNIGEQILKDLLEQMLPKSNFKLQHTFKNGERVDALLKVEDGYISVDSKFPLENFNYMVQSNNTEAKDNYKKLFIKDVKKHITDIAEKYILTDEGTLDFALMYIPSEAIYYEVVVNTPELGQYSWNKRVLAVSPNVFYSYLKAILIGLEGKKIEYKAQEILSTIKSIQTDSEKFADALRVMNKHLTNAKNTADDVYKSFEKIDHKIKSLNKIDTSKDTYLEINDA